MKLGLSLSALLFTACATTGRTMETREPDARASVQLDLSVSAQERAIFPAASEPQLPSVDRIAHQVRARLGDAVAASIEVCVAPDGHVTKVSLVEGTTYEPFNAALLRDAQEWRFAAMPGQSSVRELQTCERATVKYVTPN
jgi:TonB family protein